MGGGGKRGKEERERERREKERREDLEALRKLWKVEKLGEEAGGCKNSLEAIGGTSLLAEWVSWHPS